MGITKFTCLPRTFQEQEMLKVRASEAVHTLTVVAASLPPDGGDLSAWHWRNISQYTGGCM
jgi:hypothetical protein